MDFENSENQPVDDRALDPELYADQADATEPAEGPINEGLVEGLRRVDQYRGDVRPNEDPLVALLNGFNCELVEIGHLTADCVKNGFWDGKRTPEDFSRCEPALNGLAKVSKEVREITKLVWKLSPPDFSASKPNPDDPKNR